ncbi:MAG: FoF1 ATP synthase subunit gamma [Ferruginibacter sp.]
MLPVPKVEKKAGQKKADFIFEPGKEVLITELIPKILNTQLFKAVLDGNASEHGARMTAMDKASDNANELLKSLKISYNRAETSGYHYRVNRNCKWRCSIKWIILIMELSQVIPHIEALIFASEKPIGCVRVGRTIK